jgi:hypothetical protein
LIRGFIDPQQIPSQTASDGPEIVKEVLETLPQSTQNEPKIIEKSSTPFYTPVEPELYGIISEQEEIFDQ